MTCFWVSSADLDKLGAAAVITYRDTEIRLETFKDINMIWAGLMVPNILFQIGCSFDFNYMRYWNGDASRR